MEQDAKEEKPTLRLPLENLAERHLGLTPMIAGCFLEAAQVCLDRHHAPPIEFVFQNDKEECQAIVDWNPADDRCKDAWANETDTTTFGAYGCALAATEMLRGLVAVRRAENETGADYYVAPNNVTADDLEGWWRLEVSGTDLSKSRALSRLKEKVAQARSGKSNLPAIAAVVGFKVQLILLQTVEDTL